LHVANLRDRQNVTGLAFFGETRKYQHNQHMCVCMAVYIYMYVRTYVYVFCLFACKYMYVM
jgi:hypothetical protein